jgi:hypothetical protein
MIIEERRRIVEISDSPVLRDMVRDRLRSYAAMIEYINRIMDLEPNIRYRTGPDSRMPFLEAERRICERVRMELEGLLAAASDRTPLRGAIDTPEPRFPLSLWSREESQ